MDLPPAGHEPVLLNEVIESFSPLGGKTIIDCTLGRAGHACAIAREIGSAGLLVGLDADPRNLEFAQTQLANSPCPTRLFHANFSEIRDVISKLDNRPIDFVLADLGLSTNQLFDSRYGLSFSADMNLDMRIDPRTRQTAADLVNRMPEEDLANVLYELAQERYSRRIARKIVESRKSSPINSTERLAELVRSVIPKRRGAPDRIDPATRTFLALRMKVNREIENLETLLATAPDFLAAGGRMGIISFHSTEDRMVKQAFRSAELTGRFRILSKKPIVPTETETQANPRSRSAKLRVVEKLAAGSWQRAV